MTSTVSPYPKDGTLRWRYGPTRSVPDPGRMWCYDCDHEVYSLEEGYICSGCDREENQTEETA